MSRATRGILYAALGIFFALHQDVWFWDDARLVFGLPVGFTYHVAYCVAAAAMMGVLVKLAWPTHLDAPEDGEA